MRNQLTLATLALVVLVTLALPAQAIIRWERDIESAKQLAKQTRRLVLVHFWSDDCPPCRRLEKNVFPRAEVQRSLAAGYVAVKIHGKQSSHLTEKFDVQGWPTDIVMTPDGHELYRTTSPQDPNNYIRFLDAVAAHARVHRQPQNAAVHTAQTPQPPTARSQRESQFSSSGLAQPPRRDTANRPMTTSRYSPSQQAPTQQAPRQQAPMATSRYSPTQQAPTQQVRAPAPQPAMRTNPYVAAKPSSGQTPATSQPSRYSNQRSTQPQGTRHIAQDPADRYGRRSPAQQFAARARGGNLGRPTPSATVTSSGSHPTGPSGGSGDQNRDAGPSSQALAAPAGGGSRYSGLASQPHQVTRQTPGPSAYAPAYGRQSQPSRPPNYPSRSGSSGSRASVTDSPVQPGPRSRAALPQAQSQTTRQPALDGFCPVTLQEHRVWQRGDQRFSIYHRGRLFLCASQAELEKFKGNPEFYFPLLLGLDPVQLLQENQVVEGNRRFGLWYKKSMILFSSEASLNTFCNQPERFMPGIRQAMVTHQATGRWR